MTVPTARSALAVADVVLSAGLAARLTRFVVTEELSEWMLKHPAYRWAAVTDPEHPVTPRQRLVSGLDCPFCTGTWVHLGAQAINFGLPSRGPLRTAWRVLIISQTATWVLGHLGARLGDAGYADD